MVSQITLLSGKKQQALTEENCHELPSAVDELNDKHE